MNRNPSSNRGPRRDRSLRAAADAAIRSASFTTFEHLETRTLFAGAPTSLQSETLAAKDLANNVSATYVAPSTYLFKRGTYLTGANSGQPLDIALGYVRANAASFGLSAADIGTPVVTSQFTDEDTGMTHIYLRQQVNGLEVGNADMNVNVSRDGRILSVGSTFVSGIADLAGAAITPAMGGLSALTKAASKLGLNLTRLPQLASAPVGTAQAQVISAPDVSIDPIPAHLRYVAVPGGGVELAWQFVLNVPSGDHWYDTSVNAASGKLLYTADWVDSETFEESAETPTTAGGATAPALNDAAVTTPIGGAKETQAANYSAAYNVYAFPKLSPSNGPRTLVTNPWDNTASQYGWHDTNGDANRETSESAGNNVVAQEDANNNNGTGTRANGVVTGGVLTFDTPVDLTQAPATYQEAAITNLFYWNNILHDIHFRYGFNEVAGNFQLVNYSGQGAGNDRVNADAQDGGGVNNANFGTPVDGQSPRMQMYNWASTNPQRDGDFDASVIIHEYGHGVSTRLTGGPANSSALNSLQSGGMGEGWGDWWAIMFGQTSGATITTDQIGLATYAVGQDASGPGLRRFPYSFDKAANPLTFDLYNSETEVHRAGEIWTTTLWDMAVLLERKYGFNSNITQGYTTSAGSGNVLALKLVMDALKIQPANPSFTQARDAILQADVTLTGGVNQREIWTAFARRGLGVSTVNTGSTATTLTAAYDVPATVGNPTVNHSTPFGTTKLNTVSSFTFQFSEAMLPATFVTGTDVVSFTGPGGVDLKAQISGATWSNGNKTLVVSFPAQTADGLYSMTIGPAIQAADNGTNMDQDLNGTANQTTDRYTATANLDRTPGPDGGGYEASLTTFQNLSIASTGATALDGQDDTNTNISLGGNTFRFYGQDYSGLFVNENGLITFGSGSNAYLGGSMLNSPATATIAVLWDDLATDGAGADKVLYQIVGNQLIIEWSSIHARGNFASSFASETETFQAILSLNSGTSNGEIVLNYVDLNVGANRYSNGQSATVGIKGAGNQGPGYSGTQRLILSQDGATDSWLNSGVAVRLGLATTSGAGSSGKTFVDRNADGVQNGGDTTLAGVTVFDDANNDGDLDVGETSTVSDGSGNFALTGLAPGSHNVRSLIAGYIPTNAASGNITLGANEQASGLQLGQFPITYAGTAGNDVFNVTMDANARVVITSQAITYSAPTSLLASQTLTFTGGAGNDTLTLDASAQAPLATLSYDIAFDGGTQLAGGRDMLSVIGTPSNDGFNSSAGAAVFNAGEIVHTGVEGVVFDGKLGGDVVNVNGGPTVEFPASQFLTQLAIAAGARASMLPNGNRLLRIGNVYSVTGTGTLDLNDNDMLLSNGAATLTTIETAIAQAYNEGDWLGVGGLTSTSAKSNADGNTTLGAMTGAQFTNNGGETFDDVTPNSNDVLVKYTYFGDVNFDGAVDGIDYIFIDTGFLNGASGWANGDVDYDGAVTGIDYILVDTAFLSQGPGL